jgi:hypothetical protein
MTGHLDLVIQNEFIRDIRAWLDARKIPYWTEKTEILLHSTRIILEPEDVLRGYRDLIHQEYVRAIMEAPRERFAEAMSYAVEEDQ